MIKGVWRIIGVVVVIIFITAALFLYPRLIQGRSNGRNGMAIGANVGDRAADFTGTTLSGETIKMSEMRGKTVLINAFASWCAPCILETPHLVDTFNTSGEDVVFIGLNVLESRQAVAGYQEEFDVSYPLVLNPDGRLTEIYKPIGLPTSWFIDPEGIVRYVHAGAMTPELIQNALQSVSAGRSPDLADLTSAARTVETPAAPIAGDLANRPAPTNNRIVDNNEYNYPKLLPYDMIRPVYNPHLEPLI